MTVWTSKIWIRKSIFENLQWKINTGSAQKSQYCTYICSKLNHQHRTLQISGSKLLVRLNIIMFHKVVNEGLYLIVIFIEKFKPTILYKCIGGK